MNGYRFSLLALALAFLLALAPCALAEAGMTVTFFDAGSADAILLRAGGATVLVDAGTNKFGKTLPDLLAGMGVESIDLLIVTHFDKDHVGGADRVLGALPVRRVVEPDYEKNSKHVDQYRRALEDAGLKCEALTENLTVEIGGMTLEIDVPDMLYEQDNDNSLVTMVTYGESRLLLAADAESARIRELLDMDLRCDVLKVPHHGVYENWSPDFFAACAPRYAVITSENDDPEERETLLALQAAGAEVLLTREGTVTAAFDGGSVQISQAEQGEN